MKIQLAQKEDIEAECNKMQFISDALDTGWWEVDLEKRSLTVSVMVMKMLGLSQKSLPLIEFVNSIDSNYREIIKDHVFSASEDIVSYSEFPVWIKGAEQWVSVRFKRNGQSIIGVIHTINVPEGIASKILKKHLLQLSGISRSLFSFLHNENLDDIVNHILASLVTYFHAERAYIFEYDWENEFQSCIYEAVSREDLREIDNLQKLPFNKTTWWTEQLLALKPIILSSLDELPEEGYEEKEILRAQDIQSLIVVPFITQEKEVWAYAGIDIVDNQRNWTEEDYQWFSSLMNIINICMELGRSKAQIQNDQDRLKKLYKHMPVGLIASKITCNKEMPEDFVVVEANDEVARIMGIPREEIIGKKGAELGIQHELNLLLDTLRKGKMVENDYSVPYSNKHCKVINFSLQQDEVVSLFLDLTTVYNTHKALEKSEKLLRTMYENLPVGVALCDKNGFLVYANDKVSEILDLDSLDDYSTINIFKHSALPSDMRGKVRNGEHIDFNLNYDINTLKNSINEEVAVRNVKNLNVKFVPIKDEEQMIQNNLFIIINNTETTNAYLKIQEFEDSFSLIANLAKIGYFKWSLSLHEGFAIDQWFVNLEKPESALSTDSLLDMYEYVHPDDLKDIQEFHEKVLLGGTANFEKEIRIVCSEGKIRWLRCTFIIKQSLYNDGMELIGVNFDITELKEMILAKDKAENLDRLKSAFLANMSHEIRTPLNSIIGFTDLLAEADHEVDRKDFIAIIQRNNELLLKLVTDMLDLSKIETGNFNLIKQNFNLKTLCSEVMQTFQNRELGDVQLLLDSNLSDEIVYIDKNRVKQVLLNFITNSIKFTLKGYIKLSYQSLKDEVRFSVEDTGKGISPEDIEHIFERFVKLDNFAQGTGLGLSICKSLVEEMGGTIGVSSKPGKETCFWFTLPRYKHVFT